MIQKDKLFWKIEMKNGERNTNYENDEIRSRPVEQSTKEDMKKSNTRTVLF